MMRTKTFKRFRSNLKETVANKLCAIALLMCGWLVLRVSGDATGLVFVSFFAFPMFFAKENWIF